MLTYIAIFCAVVLLVCGRYLEKIHDTLERIEEHVRPAGYSYSDDFAEMEEVS